MVFHFLCVQTWTRIEKARRVACASPMANVHSTRLNAACAAGARDSDASNVRAASCYQHVFQISNFKFYISTFKFQITHFRFQIS